MRAQSLLAVTLAIALPAGCGDDSPGAVPTWGESSTGRPCPVIAGRAPSPSAPPAAVEEVANAPVPSLGPVSLWSHYLAYAPKRASLVVCDLATGRVATAAARAEGSSEVIDYAVGVDEVVVYATLSEVPRTQATKPVDWTLRTVDLRSGERRELATFSVLHESVPRPAAAGRWVVWTRATEEGSAVEGVDLRTGRRRVVAGAETEASGAGVTADGTAVFDGASGQGRRDVFVVPVDGSSEARRATDQGDVRSMVVGNGRAAWRTGPPNEPGERWTMVPGRDEAPIRVGTRARVVPGTDFLVAEEPVEGGFPRLAVHDLARPGTSWPLLPADERVDLGSYWDVSGDLIAWVSMEYPPTTQVKRHLRLARVVRGP